MGTESAINYLLDLIQEGDVHPLKSLLRSIQEDYETPCDYLLRFCGGIGELKNYLKDLSYLFMIENGKVSRSTDELESGQGNANKYFEGKLEGYVNPVKIEDFKKEIDRAPDDVRKFIEAFYPHHEFKRYLQRRPQLFATLNNTVSLAEKESVDYFKQALKTADGMMFTSLRGHIGQAPDHVREFINALYPGTEFRFFLEKNCHAFLVNSNGNVYLTR